MDQIEKSPTEARQASVEGVGRYVLAISTALVVVVFIIAFLVLR